MSQLKLSPELALGYSEQKFLQHSMVQEQRDHVLAEMTSSGVVRKTTAFGELEVIQGAGAQLTIKKGTAINYQGIPVIVPTDLVNHILMEESSTAYVVVLSYIESPIEKYKADIQADGVVTLTTGLATRNSQEVDFGDDGFENKLRGVSQFPSVICFPNSTVNTGEYIVQAVNSNSTLTLNVGEGVLNFDTAQEWAVVGTFTPGVVIPAADKFPFQYGLFKVELLEVGTISVLPEVEGTGDDPEYIRLAIVSYNEGVMTISDKRGINLYNKSTFI